MDAFDRHFRACDNAVLPGGRLQLHIGAADIGWVRPAFADVLRGLSGFTVGTDAVEIDPAAPDSLPRAAKALCERGVLRWRGEAFDVRAGTDGPVLTTIDRGALPAFGIAAHGVHVNGLVQQGDTLHVWVAKRAADKLLDPGKLDHIVAGGVPAGLSEAETLVKEAGEEAGIGATLARQAVPVGRIAYAMERPEGLRRDVLHAYDLHLPAEFLPQPVDGEIEHFELWPVRRAYETVRDTDAFKFNVNLVLIDLFRRLGLPT